MLESNEEKRSWKLSPSDFAFLWDDCKRCFYLKLVRKFDKPSTPFPSVFSKIAGMQKRFFDNQSTQSLVPELPSGTFAFGEKYVKSQVISLPGNSTSCFISGRFDMVARFEDDTYGVLDFKTSEPRESNIEKYRRQLHAYTYALENPAPNSFSLSPVSLLGLLVLDPSKMVSGQSGKGYFIKCELTWIPFERNDEEFRTFIGNVLSVLESPETPAPSPTCSFCNYRENSRITGY